MTTVTSRTSIIVVVDIVGSACRAGRSPSSRVVRAAAITTTAVVHAQLQPPPPPLVRTLLGSSSEPIGNSIGNEAGAILL